MHRYLFSIFLYGFSILISNSVSESKKYIDLWDTIKKRITIDYANDFSSQDVNKFISYFAPNRKIDLYQYQNNIIDKSEIRKPIKLYNGNIISSLVRLRIPAQLMATTLFNRLKKQDYKESKIQLLGILIEDNVVIAYTRFDRINQLNEIYESARGLYRLININDEWLIIEMSTYIDDESVNKVVGYDKMFKYNTD